MNFLQLCQATARDSGTVAGVPSLNSVAGATGRVRQLTDWVRDAYIDIQNEREDWLFMRQRFEGTLQTGLAEYTADNFNINDFGSWLPDVPQDDWYSMTIYESGQKARETTLRQVPYRTWQEQYQRGVHDSTQPTEWAIAPRGGLVLGATPDKDYIITGEYRMAPQELVADDDVPLMPPQFHRLIIGEALRLMARSDEAFQVLNEKTEQYTRLRAPLVANQTPPIEFGGNAFA